MIPSVTIRSIPGIIDYILRLSPAEGNVLYFRGESRDYGDTACIPSIYRNKKRLEHEHIILREMQRFNDHEFIDDRTVFDRLARMQHHKAPTRTLDMTEDILSSLYFALDGQERMRKEGKRDIASSPVIFVFEVEKSAIKFYDADTVSVLSNLAALPLESADGSPSEKSKARLHKDAKKFFKNREAFNQTQSARFLLHEIRDEKPHFEPIIDPQHIFSVFCVKPKYTNRRIRGQKGALLLFGLNPDNCTEPIRVLDSTNWTRNRSPIRRVNQIKLAPSVTLRDLETLGITEPYMYPELDGVAEYLSCL